MKTSLIMFLSLCLAAVMAVAPAVTGSQDCVDLQSQETIAVLKEAEAKLFADLENCHERHHAAVVVCEDELAWVVHNCDDKLAMAVDDCDNKLAMAVKDCHDQKKAQKETIAVMQVKQDGLFQLLVQAQAETEIQLEHCSHRAATAVKECDVKLALAQVETKDRAAAAAKECDVKLAWAQVETKDRLEECDYGVGAAKIRAAKMNDDQKENLMMAQKTVAVLEDKLASATMELLKAQDIAMHKMESTKKKCDDKGDRWMMKMERCYGELAYTKEMFAAKEATIIAERDAAASELATVMMEMESTKKKWMMKMGEQHLQCIQELGATKEMLAAKEATIEKLSTSAVRIESEDASLEGAIVGAV